MAGILAVLAVLGSAFAVLSRLERKAASQRVHGTRAWLLARSGVEDALARIASGQDPEGNESRYAGENWDASSDGLLSGYEAEQEVYRKSGAGGRADVESCPVEQALRPSFFTRAGSNPAVERTDGRDRGYTGRLAGGSYALRIRTGGFDVNGGDPAFPASGPTAGYNATLRRMMGNLAEAIDREDGVNDALPVDQADGWRLLDSRPPAGWQSFAQVLALALGGSATKLDALEPYLTLHAIPDLKVVASNARYINNQYGFAWTSLAERKTRRKVRGTTTAPDFERIGGRIVGRSPVSLPWARTRRPALLALMAGLKGLHLHRWQADNTRIGWEIEAEVKSDWTATSDDCRMASAQILSSTSELLTWQEFNDFCDTLTMTSSCGWAGGNYPSPLGPQGADLLQAKRDILKANFNPNSGLNPFNPDLSVDRLVDKASLTAYSAEFDLRQSRGGRIRSVGRILGPGGRLLASRTLSAGLVPERRLVLTTQGEFVAGNLGKPDVAGDESAFRAYGSAPFITNSGGTGKTFAHRLFGNPGASLQSWPEPHVVWTAGAGRPAEYDGRLGLATVESDDRGWAPTGVSMLFLARWDDGFNADYSMSGTGNLTRLNSPLGGSGSLPAPTASIYESSRPGQLHPDGVFLESARTFSYESAANLPRTRGILSFWAKPDFDSERFVDGFGTTRNNRVFLNNTRQNPSPPAPVLPRDATGAFLLAWGSPNAAVAGRVWPMTHVFAVCWDDDFTSNNDVTDEALRWTPFRLFTMHRWHLVTCLWDTRTPVASESARIRIDRGLSTDPQDRDDGIFRSVTRTTMTATGFDHTVQPGGTASFCLGPFGYGALPAAYPLISPEATLDEFATYDLGDSPGSALLLDALVRDRYEAGRYYKESEYPASGGLTTPPGLTRNAGEWFSAPIDLGSVRLSGISWTEILPRGLRAPGPSAGQKAEAGDPGPDAHVRMELAHAGVQVPATPGASYALDARGNPIDALFGDARGERLDRTVRAPFRLHAVFQPNLDEAGKQNKAVLDPLALDDVTVAYRDPSEPLFLEWGN